MDVLGSSWAFLAVLRCCGVFLGVLGFFLGVLRGLGRSWAFLSVLGH